VAKYFTPSSWAAMCVFLAGAVALVMPSGYSIGFYGLGFAGLLTWLLVRDRLLKVDAYAFVLPVLFVLRGNLLKPCRSN